MVGKGYLAPDHRPPGRKPVPGQRTVCRFSTSRPQRAQPKALERALIRRTPSAQRLTLAHRTKPPASPLSGERNLISGYVRKGVHGRGAPPHWALIGTTYLTSLLRCTSRDGADGIS